MSEEATTEVVTVDTPEPSVAEITQPTTRSLQRLRAEVLALDEAYHWAKAMSKTSMVPEDYQFYAKPRGCTDIRGERATYDLAAAVLYGSEIGLSAMQSAQNVFVVHGKPAVYARTMAAQVRAAGYVIEEVEASDEKVVWKALRDGVWAFSEWDIRRATTAGYTSNDRYRTNPQEMLRAKATAEVCRIKFQDILLGMAYSVEELQLEESTVQRVVRRGPKGERLRELAEARYDDMATQPPADEPPAEAPDPVTNVQLGQIRKLYKEQGVTGQAILAAVNDLLKLDSPLKTLNELSNEQAEKVISEATNSQQKGPDE
jgi:hypothetical protein